MGVLTENKYRLYFLNRENIISNIDNIILYANKDLEKITSITRKSLFFQSLNKLQNVDIPNSSDNIMIQFQNEQLLENLIKRRMMSKEDTENNKHLYNEEEQKEIRYNIEKALELINILHPDLHNLIHLLTGTYACYKKEGFGGGSVSSIIGLTWLSPPKKWTVIDYAEALYHEFVHNSLFLDDMVNSVFPDPTACAQEEALVTSTILKRKRPLDRAYHSACVAVALMHFYYMLRDFKKMESFYEPLRKTVFELNEKEEYLGERGLETLKGLNDFIKSQNYEEITSELRFE